MTIGHFYGDSITKGSNRVPQPPQARPNSVISDLMQTPYKSHSSLQLGVFRLGLFQNRDVGVGVFP
jgi:hypothetical protein